MAARVGWDLSCPDWEERLRAGQTPIPDLPLNREDAERAVSLFNLLRIPDVPGKPCLEKAAGDWQREIVAALFGSIDPVTGRRMVREVLVEVPKKNSKSTGGGAIALVALLLNERPNADLILIGPTQEIAKIAFKVVKGMIEAEPVLAKKLDVKDYKKEVHQRVTGATLRVLTFDEGIATGSKPVFILVDELHLMGPMAKASYVIGQLRGGQLPFPEAMMVFITTQSDRAPTGVWKDELTKARNIRDGKVPKARMLPVLYEFSEAMQRAEDRPWADPKNWPMVMPNLGLSLDIEPLIEAFEEAQATGEAELRRWASQHLNLEIGVALHGNRWRGADYWEAAGDQSLTLETLLERSEVAVLGIDGGGLDDLFGLCAAGRERDTGTWLFWLRAWAHEEVLERRKGIEAKIKELEEEGTLTICQTSTQDYEEATAIAKQVLDSGLMPERRAVGLDPQGVSNLVDMQLDVGFTDEQLVAVPQGFRLHSSVVGLERKFKDKTARHDGTALGRWCVGNAKVETRGNAQVVSKQESGRGKIDPLIAMFNGAKLLEWKPVPTKPRTPFFQVIA